MLVLPVRFGNGVVVGEGADRVLVRWRPGDGLGFAFALAPGDIVTRHDAGSGARRMVSARAGRGAYDAGRLRAGDDVSILRRDGRTLRFAGARRSGSGAWVALEVPGGVAVLRELNAGRDVLPFPPGGRAPAAPAALRLFRCRPAAASGRGCA